MDSHWREELQPRWLRREGKRNHQITITVDNVLAQKGSQKICNEIAHCIIFLSFPIWSALLLISVAVRIGAQLSEPSPSDIPLPRKGDILLSFQQLCLHIFSPRMKGSQTKNLPSFATMIYNSYVTNRKNLYTFAKWDWDYTGNHNQSLNNQSSILIPLNLDFKYWTASSFQSDRDANGSKPAKHGRISDTKM